MTQRYTISSTSNPGWLLLRRYRNGIFFHSIFDKKEYIEGYASGLEENGWERWTELEEMERMELEVQQAKEHYLKSVDKLREMKFAIEAMQYRWKHEDEMERRMKEGRK